jgi:zinc transport system substrate-binding protein
MTRRSILLLVAAVVAVVVAGCREAAPKAGTPIKAVVTVAPLKGILEPLLPEGSSVRVLMQPGRSEHGYEFTPSDIAELADADIVVHVGLGLEGNLAAVLEKQKVPLRQVVCFADAVGIKEDGHDHAHDHDHDHAHHDHAADPHLWLNPVLVDALVPSLSLAVLKSEEARGKKSEEVLKRLDVAAMELRRRIRSVDETWGESLKPFRGQAVVTHHNAFSRPAERYGFQVAEVIRAFEGEPTPGDLAKVVDAIKAQNVRVIFVEPQFDARAAERIAELAGVSVGSLDPIGDGDWFKLMEQNLASLVKHLGTEPERK